MADNTAITKADLDGMEARISATTKADLEGMEARILERISAECEKVETKLLSEFWKWGRTSDVRTREALGAVGAAGERANSQNERMMNIEDRVSALERRGA